MIFGSMIRRRCERRRCQHPAAPVFLILGPAGPMTYCGFCRAYRNATIRKFWFDTAFRVRVLGMANGKGVIA